MVWIILHDEGGGVTERSKDFFAKNIEEIGQPFEVNVRSSGSFSFEIQAKDGIILLSGFNCGYSGTGPHGSVWALQRLGVAKKLAEELFSAAFITFDLRGEPRISEKLS